ncbi:hypothetical protein MRS76_18545 [Rhizobiaceae bacterium n13]|uniref:Arginine/ornithine antiporter ArcD n=1 Tax=Ferirhizobium litorale TaxID=2927786 RepID=A0AAE3QJ97_9HYPH|nr:hypothetical protein [Fererhizobium litorale]MDI7863953.1 hypothetical protein [Fererhizobium litorale]MDI7924214.1 hypothetical protein [Fererhizobium litorale]
MSDLWPWLLLAGLGAFHGLNPAMGWLFAVALGVHRQSSSAVMQAVPAIALGHAASVTLVAGALIAAGVLVDQERVRMATGAFLLAWAVWHHFLGHRRRVRIGMRTGLAGLVLWSFLMATAHGAGLMVLPALVPLCLSGLPLGPAGPGATAAATFAAVGVHMVAMLTATGLVALVVYRWVGLGILRSAWINIDLIWTVVLFATGIVLLL